MPASPTPNTAVAWRPTPSPGSSWSTRTDRFRRGTPLAACSRTALVSWIHRDRPSLLKIYAVIEWIKGCKSLGPPTTNEIQSPDTERTEDHLTTIPMANIDVLYMAHEGPEESIMMVRDFTSF